MPTDRVSQSRKDQDMVQLLNQAAVTLRRVADTADTAEASEETARREPGFASGPELRKMADAVDFVLTDDGRKFIGRLAWQTTAQKKPNLALEMPEVLRDTIKAKAAAAGASLEAEAEHALREFVAGRFTPARPERFPRGQTPRKANLNIRVDGTLRAEATDLGKELLAQGELDWAPGITNILTSYFADRVEESFVNPVRKKQDQEQ